MSRSAAASFTALYSLFSLSRQKETGLLIQILQWNPFLKKFPSFNLLPSSFVNTINPSLRLSGKPPAGNLSAIIINRSGQHSVNLPRESFLPGQQCLRTSTSLDRPQCSQSRHLSGFVAKNSSSSTSESIWYTKFLENTIRGCHLFVCRGIRSSQSPALHHQSLSLWHLIS